LRFPAWLAILGAFASAVLLEGQSQPPVNGPVYWSSSIPNCSGHSLGTTKIVDANGNALGYSCYVTGVFLWFAGGGMWSSDIRVAAPVTNPIGVDYTFYDAGGGKLSLDTKSGSTSTVVSGSDLGFAITANQASDIQILGATSDSPKYGNTATGSVFAAFYCPDPYTCLAILPQLVFSALPSFPWAESVPITWDGSFAPQWSSVGVDDGNTKKVSFVVYNQGSITTSFTVRVYDSNGNLAGSGTTPAIFGSSTAQGGTYGALLENVITTPLPSGPLKILVDGGSVPCAVEAFQFNGPSATNLQSSYDYAPGTVATLNQAKRFDSQQRVPSAVTVLGPLAQ